MKLFKKWYENGGKSPQCIKQSWLLSRKKNHDAQSSDFGFFWAGKHTINGREAQKMWGAQKNIYIYIYII
jgi:hypothetical protein